MMKKLTGQRGFTLMELMVVIVIVAILAAVAVPLYINYVNDARRTEAKGAIGAILTAEQTYFQQNNSYVNDTFTNGIPAILSCDLSEPSRNWDFTISGAGAAGFVATATGKAAPYNGLTVTLTYNRATGPAWTP